MTLQRVSIRPLCSLEIRLDQSSALLPLPQLGWLELPDSKLEWAWASSQVGARPPCPGFSLAYSLRLQGSDSVRRNSLESCTVSTLTNVPTAGTALSDLVGLGFGCGLGRRPIISQCCSINHH
jgi:hypothetical protein